jgi:hypothetical protein
MKTYRSAVSPVLSFIIGISWAGLMGMTLLAGDGGAIIILAAVALFFLYLYLSTTYAIDGTTLHVRSGFLFKERVDVGTITRISSVRDFFAAPALALDRLVIRYGQDRSVLISPRNRRSFLKDLCAINPSIAFDGLEPS